MATRKKAKGKTKAKRKKVSKATRGKATKARNKPVKRISARRPSPKKTAPTAGVAVKARPASSLAQAVAPKPTPAAPPGKRIGVVTHYYSHVSVAILRLEPGTTLRVGDVIHIRGNTTDFSQKVESLEVDHAPVTEVGPKDDFGLKVAGHVREHDVVYKMRP